MNSAFTVIPVLGIPEINGGDNLGQVILDAIENGPTLMAGDIIVITSKVVSKAENEFYPSSERDKLIDDESIRLLAHRGSTKIVQTKHGLIMAAAGVDASNAPAGTVLKLPVDSDVSARKLKAFFEKSVSPIGVIITDTMGRAWRVGLTDNAIGVAGVEVLHDYRGQRDAAGRTLELTVVAVVDQIASAAELVKGKADQIPVVVVRGLEKYVTVEDGVGARALIRPANEDMFSLGVELAERRGYEKGVQGRSIEERN